MKRTLVRSGGILLAILLVLQLVPVDRSNPPEPAPIREPAEVVAVLERSCFDCHSNRTRWPWYAYVAPFSWLVAHDVEEGRSHVNFSEWGTLEPRKQRKIREEVWEEVEEGHMPPSTYLLMHPDARPSEADRAVLRRWAGEGEDGEDDEDGEDEHRHDR